MCTVVYYNYMTPEIDSEQSNDDLPFDDDSSLWRICSRCRGDGCACCDYEGSVYDPEPDGTN